MTTGMESRSGFREVVRDVADLARGLALLENALLSEFFRDD